MGLTRDTDFRRTSTERNSFSGAVEVLPADNQRLLLRAAFSRDRYDTDAGIPTQGGEIPDGISRSRRFNPPQDLMAYRWYEVGAEYSIEPMAGVRDHRSRELRAEPVRLLLRRGAGAGHGSGRQRTGGA